MEMSITRGLSELKLLKDRIERKIQSSKYIVGNKKSNKKIDGIYTKEELITTIKADYQSVLDLINRRKIIKAEIVKSNANTVVKISGKEMTVAEAIERKESIQFEKTLLNTMEQHYRLAIAKVANENEKVQANLDNLLNTTFGKENKNKTAENEIKIISDPYLEQNEWEVINPLKLQEEIGKLKSSIEDFLNEVDFSLSESNTITKIQIPE